MVWYEYDMTPSQRPVIKGKESAPALISDLFCLTIKLGPARTNYNDFCPGLQPLLQRDH